MKRILASIAVSLCAVPTVHQYKHHETPTCVVEENKSERKLERKMYRHEDDESIPVDCTDEQDEQGDEDTDETPVTPEPTPVPTPAPTPVPAPVTAPAPVVTDPVVIEDTTPIIGK